MGAVYARGLELAGELTAAGLPATADPQDALGLLPCVLVGPPALESRHYGGHIVAWRLVALAASAEPAQAWEQLDSLLSRLTDLLSWERAEPSSYVLPSGTDPVPAYVVTYTETVTED